MTRRRSEIPISVRSIREDRTLSSLPIHLLGSRGFVPEVSLECHMAGGTSNDMVSTNPNHPRKTEWLPWLKTDAYRG